MRLPDLLAFAVSDAADSFPQLAKCEGRVPAPDRQALQINRSDFGALRSAIRARQFNDAGLHEQHHPRNKSQPPDAANGEH